MAEMPPSMTESNAAAQEGFLDPEEQYRAFLFKYQKVKQLSWNNDTLFVHLVSGETEIYPWTPKGTTAAKKKYGRLPSWFPPVPSEASLAPPPPPPSNIDLPKKFQKRNPTVAGLSSDEGTFHVILKSGEVESFDSTPAGFAAFEKKYGPIPPPPPPVPKTDK
jgi:hypothetical protein